MGDYIVPYWISPLQFPRIIFYLYLMVPANSGLKAYSQSCISLSLVACSSIPRCSVHTANVLGVWRREIVKISSIGAFI